LPIRDQGDYQFSPISLYYMCSDQITLDTQTGRCLCNSSY